MDADRPPVVAVDAVGATTAAALHGLLDAPGPAPRTGEALPPLWQWLAFLPAAAQRDLGPDGHPAIDPVLPPAALPKRMFAGGRSRSNGTLAVDSAIERSSRVTSMTEKVGRSGRLVFVTVEHALGPLDGPPVLVEEQDLVYREDGGEPSPPLPERAEVDGDWDLALDLDVDPTLLFRFSALTYNAHRIHYDRRYATEVEGYPGLVVHGPLQAIALAELCRRDIGRRLASFEFRAVRPVFDDGPLRLRGRRQGDAVTLSSFDGAGRPAVTATATLA